MALTVVSRANAVPITLTGPTRYLSATQAHATGNLLVALFHLNNGTVVSLTNLAGDTWVRSTLSPYLPGTIHHHEVWYCLATKGHPADILTVIVTGEAELAITVYEAAPSVPTLQVQYVGDAAANIQVDGNTPPTINSGLLALTQPSLILATYRNSLGTVPTAPSGTQFAAFNDGGVTSYYDCWQAASVPAAVTAIAGANNTFPQWTILASAFTEIGFGCAQDLPALPSTGGSGCSTDLPSAVLVLPFLPPLPPPTLPPTLLVSSLTPTNGPVGASVALDGTAFGATQGASMVTFNGVPAAVNSWAGAHIVVTVPAGAATGPVVVTVSALPSPGVTFTVTTVPPPSGPYPYTSRSDRLISGLPTLPTLGPAGFQFTDPSFASPMLRVTDSTTRADSLNISYRTPDASPAFGWDSTGTCFWILCPDGSTWVYTYDPVAFTATKAPLQLPFNVQPIFDEVNTALLYGAGASFANHVTLITHNRVSLVDTVLVDLTTVPGVPDLTNTYTNAMSLGNGIFTVLFGGASQDQHYLILVRPLAAPGTQYLVNTLTHAGLGFHLHSQSIDRTGRYLILFPSNADFQANIATSQIYILDLLTDTATRITSDWGGHAVPGFATLINQDVASGTWDAAQWSLRQLAAPNSPSNVISPILTPPRDPNVTQFGEHTSWRNAQAGVLRPMITATYLFATRTPYRPWDEELLGISTDGTFVVNRFAHHRSLTARDSDPANYQFEYTPRPNVNPQGTAAILTSNWGKTLGVDPVTGLHRTDVFLVKLT